MRLLLDTNALLWALADRARLADDARTAIEASANDVFVSPIGPWEIEIKRARGRLRAPADVVGAVARAGFASLPIAVEHAVAAGRLPLHHRDPFDRMLVAQAQLEGLTIVTSDSRIACYQVAVLAA